MSRTTKWNENRRYEVAFGHDRACGWYAQVWDHSLPEDDADTPIVNIDETQTTKGECNPAIIKLVGTDHGVEITDEELGAAQAESPRGPSRFQGFLDQIEAQLGNPAKGDA